MYFIVSSFDTFLEFFVVVNEFALVVVIDDVVKVAVSSAFCGGVSNVDTGLSSIVVGSVVAA